MAAAEEQFLTPASPDGVVQGREVKFGYMLERLIERGGYKRNRIKILRALDISPAALSQYVRGQTRPSFAKLLAMANFFDVSLDYLVYGQPTSSLIDYGPLYRYVDHALASVQARSSRHSAIAARIGRVLADRIDAVAGELAAAPTAAREGLVRDDEALRLEGYCHEGDILSLNLEFEAIHVEKGVAAGRFLPVVAANLGRGAVYRFLVSGIDQDWDSTVDACRRMLAAQVGGDRVRENCAFRRTDAPVMTGAALYKLDAIGLQAQEPALYVQISDYIGEDGWFGYVIRANDDSNSDMLMDPAHTRRAQAAFNALWSSSTAV
jgi:transcriptional regulator with XRE-family HTH domain